METWYTKIRHEYAPCKEDITFIISIHVRLYGLQEFHFAINNFFFF